MVYKHLNSQVYNLDYIKKIGAVAIVPFLAVGQVNQKKFKYPLNFENNDQFAKC